MDPLKVHTGNIKTSPGEAHPSLPQRAKGSGATITIIVEREFTENSVLECVDTETFKVDALPHSF